MVYDINLSERSFTMEYVKDGVTITSGLKINGILNYDMINSMEAEIDTKSSKVKNVISASSSKHITTNHGGDVILSIEGGILIGLITVELIAVVGR